METHPATPLTSSFQLPGDKSIAISNLSGPESLGAIASADPRTIIVLRKYGMDFCCGGKKSIADACAEKGIDLRPVLEELKNVELEPVIRPLPCNRWSPDFLCEYIVRTHHDYVKATLPELKMYVNKVAAVHGDQHPALKEIKRLVLEMASEMTEHMAKEENVVFPYIASLVKGTQEVKPTGSMELMELEHEQVGELVHQIRIHANDYQLPADACGSYQHLYRLLQQFEDDLHLHVHLENNILFPKAAILEKSSL